MQTEAQSPKSRRRKEARPAEIIAAGIAEFHEYGFQKANLARIAKRAGIAKGTIYLYFPSKEALFLAAIEDHVTSVIGAGEARLTLPDGTTRELITQLLREMFARFVNGEAQALFRILLIEGDRIPDVIAQYHTLTMERGAKLLTDILIRGVARGEVRPGPVIEMPHVIIAPAIHYSVHSMMFHRAETLDFDAYFEAHLDLLFAGIMTEAG